MIKYDSKDINIEHFPNNELRIRNIEYKEDALVEFKYESSDDLIALIFLKKSIDEKGFNANLYIRYMPYSRMDREFDNGDLFLLKYIADIINNLKFKNVYVLEPHSKVTEELINNITVIRPMSKLLELVKEDINFTEKDHIVFPDLGAYKRYYSDNMNNTIQFDKKRNNDTTLIKHIYLESGIVIKGSKCIILDDVCSTGSTVLSVAEILKNRGVKEVYILTVHTENQVLENPVLGPNTPVDAIYTTDSLITKAHQKIKILPYKL